MPESDSKVDDIGSGASSSNVSRRLGLMACNAEDWTVSMTANVNMVILEFCCDVESAISTFHSPEAFVVRFTEKSDLTKPATWKRAIEIIDSRLDGRIMMWASIPCTGGAAFQKLNAAKGVGLEKQKQK